jgi:hypothetical protein
MSPDNENKGITDTITLLVNHCIKKISQVQKL